jgi:hypothetical protein
MYVTAYTYSRAYCYCEYCVNKFQIHARVKLQQSTFQQSRTYNKQHAQRKVPYGNEKLRIQFIATLDTICVAI